MLVPTGASGAQPGSSWLPSHRQVCLPLADCMNILTGALLFWSMQFTDGLPSNDWSSQARARANHEDHRSVLETSKWRTEGGDGLNLYHAAELEVVEESLQKAGLADHRGQSPERHGQRVSSDVHEV